MRKSMLDQFGKVTRGMVNLVNTQSSVDAKTRDILIPKTSRRILIEIVEQAGENRLAVGLLSELSALLPGNKMAINTFDAPFNKDNVEFAVLVLSSGKAMTGLIPSRHSSWHQLVYKHTAASFALLCQPVAAMVFANRMELPDAHLLEDLKVASGGISCTMPGADAISSTLAENHSLLICGYGLLVWDIDPGKIIARALMVNRWCEIALAGGV